MKRRDKHQRTAYALRRLSVAVDRVIVAKTPEDKQRAMAWAKAWGILGQFPSRN